MEKLLKFAYENGFVSIWASEHELAKEFAEKLGWKISFVTLGYLDAELFFVYKNKECLPQHIQEQIKGEN